MKSGTYISDLAYEQKDYEGKYEKIGALLFYRSASSPGTAKIRIDQMFPPEKTIIGKFLSDSESVKKKFDTAPYIEGDMFVRVYGNKEKIGHVHSSQNEHGDTLYFLEFICDMSLIFKAHNRIFGHHPCSVWIETELE